LTVPEGKSEGHKNESRLASEARNEMGKIKISDVINEMSKIKIFVLTHPGCTNGHLSLAARDDLDEAKTLGLRFGEGTIITHYVGGDEMPMPWVLKRGQWVVKD
jgi:hypothetical protein